MPLSNDELIQELVDKGMAEDEATAVVNGIKPREHKLVKKGEDRKAA
jgi:polyhydroxyalkanoate synthesis regulator phasin